MVRGARLALLAVALGFAGILAATRAGALAPRPGLLAGLGAAAGVLASVALALAATRLVRRREGRLAAAGESLLLAGVLAVAAAGLANWLLGFQGFAVLTEGDALPLARGTHLQGFTAGPAARLDDLAGTLRLARVEIVPAPAGGFVAESALETLGIGAPEAEVVIRSGRGAVAGPLVLHQGAFGFAPRLVIEKDGAVVFDRTVPFTSRREGATGVSFEQQLVVEAHRLAVDAVIGLDGLDERMKGHPVLALEVRREGQLLGKGILSPGHAAALDGGWSVGFAGLRMWSEIDVARRSYRTPALAGMALAALGALLWPIAARRGR
ncbi:MAG TPA: hypothetical protein VLS93_04655 [Anaeromyxobacteraceae bacterium]|nr:hypothetical protein [Anaeromyxobacteraceae bacterium]